ncbi:hypothetical protein [Actinoplanes sp. M2I2]|uniref:hypothetical protein n=1 Tax=Actinoplanes sp. M2I2 TaxID=1734444 RepID=UPI0020218A00|nr:hypothetical protein [Actinoplanes sp. M2I2]
MSGSVKRFLLSMLASKLQKRAHHGGHNAVANGLLREVNNRIARSQGHGHHPGAYGQGGYGPGYGQGGYGPGYGHGAYGPPPAYGHHGHYKHHGHYRHHGHYKKRRPW